MQVGEARQRHRLHLGRGVGLHRARSEGIIRGPARSRAPRAAQVAQHLGLAVVLGRPVGRNSVSARSSSTARRRRQRRPRSTAGAVTPKASAPAPTVVRVVRSVVLIADGVGVDRAGAGRARWPPDHLRGPPGAARARVSKKRSCATGVTGLSRRQPSTAAYRWVRARSPAQPGRGRRRTCSPRRRAGPGQCRCWSRLVPADVLLARLERQAVRRAASASTETPTSRPGGAARGRRGPPCSRRAGRRRTTGRRSAGWTRRRRRRRGSRRLQQREGEGGPAATTASASRSWACSITRRGSSTRPEAPGTARARRTARSRARRRDPPVGEVGDDDLDAEALRTGYGSRRRSAGARRRHDEQAGRLPVAPPGPGSSPRPPRCPRRAATRWRSAGR